MLPHLCSESSNLQIYCRPRGIGTKSNLKGGAIHIKIIAKFCWLSEIIGHHIWPCCFKLFPKLPIRLLDQNGPLLREGPAADPNCWATCFAQKHYSLADPLGSLAGPDKRSHVPDLLGFCSKTMLLLLITLVLLKNSPWLLLGPEIPMKSWVFSKSPSHNLGHSQLLSIVK